MVVGGMTYCVSVKNALKHGAYRKPDISLKIWTNPLCISVQPWAKLIVSKFDFKNSKDFDIFYFLVESSFYQFLVTFIYIFTYNLGTAK